MILEISKILVEKIDFLDHNFRNLKIPFFKIIFCHDFCFDDFFLTSSTVSELSNAPLNIV